MLKRTIFRQLVFLALGFILGAMTFYIPLYYERQENAYHFHILARNNPIIPLKEYASIMNASDGSIEDFVEAYAKIDRTAYYINVFSATYQYVPESEFHHFIDDYSKTIERERFKEIISRLNNSGNINKEDMDFLKAKARQFNNLPEPSMKYSSFEEFFYSVRDSLGKIKEPS